MPILLLMMVTALFFNVVQVGFLMSPDALMPKLNRLDPIQGVKRIFSIQSTVKLLVSLGKLAAVIAIAALSLSFSLPWRVLSSLTGICSRPFFSNANGRSDAWTGPIFIAGRPTRSSGR